MRWQVRVDADTGRSYTSLANGLYGLPGGVLVTAQRGVYGYGGRRAQVQRYDQHGTLQWERLFGYRAWGIATVPMPDGTYWVVANDYTQNWRTLPTPTTPGTYYGQDIRLMHLSATGDSLGCVWWGSYSTWEAATTAKATTDGGLILSARYADPPSNTYAGSMLVKLDAAGTEQWRYVWPKRPGTSSSPPAYLTGNELYDVQELTDGRFVVCGRPFDLSTNYYESSVGWLAPPDVQHPSPREVWRLNMPFTLSGNFREVVGVPRQLFFVNDSANTLRLFGQGYRFSDQNLWLAELTNAGQAAVINYCAVLPSRPRVTVGPLQGDSLTFTLQRQGQTAGPPLAELSLVEWDFGDGSPPASGWTVTHRFATPAPVAVRLRVCNNLGCCRDTTLYPFGIPTAAPTPVPAAPLVSVYPNPSATGVFTVRGAGGATATVVDALGRVVGAGKLDHAPEARLSLATEAGGVYALRLRWPDGRAITKRLMR